MPRAIFNSALDTAAATAVIERAILAHLIDNPN